MSPVQAGPAAIVARFAGAIYLIAVLCMIAPPLDIVFSLPSADMSSVRWRFGAVGLLTGAAMFPLLGLLLALVTSTLCGHRWMQRIALTLSILATIVLTIAVGLFVLDALQVRREVNPQLLRRFDFTVIKAIIMQLAHIVALIVLVLAGMRASRQVPRTAAAPAEALVMAGAPRGA